MPSSLMRMASTLWITLMALVACAPPAVRGNQLAGAALHADNALLKRVLLEVHPGSTRYRTRAEIDATFEALDHACAQGLDRDAYFVELARVTAFVRCGHTFPSPYNLPDATAREMFGRCDRIPLHFRWIDGRMIVLRGFGDAAHIARGSEIISIDGVAAGEVLQALLPLVAADGSNDAKRAELLQITGLERFPQFDLLYPRVRGHGRTTETPRAFTLEFRGPRAASTTVLRAAPIEQRARDAAAFELDRAARDDRTPLWTLTHEAPVGPRTVACLRMPSWVTYNSKWDWRSFLDGAFDELVARGTSDLVIDLRGNAGGSAIGPAILSRLVASATSVPNFRRMVRYRSLPADLSPHLDTWDDSFRDWGNAAGPPTTLDSGTLRPLVREGERSDGIDLIEPRGARYEGRVWIITSAGNSSATFEFALAARTLGLATLVGQPTGGNLRGINGGAFFFLRLPASGLEVDIPIMAFVPPEGQPPRPDAGLAPDVAVVPSATDIAGSVDAEMQAVRAAISSRN